MPSPQELTALQRALSKNDLHIGAPKGGSDLPMPEPEDAPIHKTAQLVQDWIGGPSPSEGPSQAVARIPPAEAKALGKALLEETKANTPEFVHRALEFAQQRYPRIFGHLGGVFNKEMSLDLSGVYDHSMTTIPGNGNINLNMGSLGSKTPEVLGHELTHAAQDIWAGPKFQNRYNDQSALHGYYENPYEVGARKAGENFNRKLNQGVDNEIMQKALNLSYPEAIKYVRSQGLPFDQETKLVHDVGARMLNRPK